jgi:hypothetical protein
MKRDPAKGGPRPAPDQDWPVFMEADEKGHPAGRHKMTQLSFLNYAKFPGQ